MLGSQDLTPGVRDIFYDTHLTMKALLLYRLKEACDLLESIFQPIVHLYKHVVLSAWLLHSEVESTTSSLGLIFAAALDKEYFFMLLLLLVLASYTETFSIVIK